MAFEARVLLLDIWNQACAVAARASAGAAAALKYRRGYVVLRVFVGGCFQHTKGVGLGYTSNSRCSVPERCTAGTNHLLHHLASLRLCNLYDLSQKLPVRRARWDKPVCNGRNTVNSRAQAMFPSRSCPSTSMLLWSDAYAMINGCFRL